LASSTLADSVSMTAGRFHTPIHSGDDWDTLYLESSGTHAGGGDTIWCADTGIVVGSSNWVIDMRGPDGIAGNSDDDTLYFGTDSTFPVARGILLDQTYDSLVILGGVVWNAPEHLTGNETEFVYSDTLNKDVMGIYIKYGNDYCHIYKTTVRVLSGWGSSSSGTGGWCIGFAGSSKNNWVDSCTTINDASAFYDRQYAPQRNISMAGVDAAGIDWSSDDYHLWILGGTHTNRCNTTIYVDVPFGSAETDSALVYLDNVDIVLDVRNLYEDSSASQYADITNSYGLHLDDIAGGSRIENCTFNSGSNHGGGRALLLQRPRGSAADSIKITGNHFRSHERASEYYGGSNSIWSTATVKIRTYRAYNYGGLYVADNFFTVIADTCHEDSTRYAYWPKASALVYEYWDGSRAATPPYYDVFENNHCSALVVSDVDNPGSNNWAVAAVRFEDIWDENTGLTFRNNYLYSEGNWIVTYGNYDGGTPQEYRTLMEGDTFNLVTASNITQATVNLGDSRNVDSCRFRDIVYQGDAAPGDVTYIAYQTGSALGSGAQDAYFEQTPSILVRDAGANPLENALVRIVDSLGDTVMYDTTGADGLANTKFVHFNFQSRTAADTSYNRMKFFAFLGSKSDSTTNFELDEAQFTDTLDLDTTIAGGSPNKRMMILR
jgi:hypothetical protein